MTASTENKFNNHSGPKSYFSGRNSKFTPSQLQERLVVHAKALATGSPTIKEIVAYWKEKYDIDIHPMSEKEWRASNRDDIEKKKMELVESGDLTIPVVSEEILADTMMDMVLSNAKTSRSLKKQFDSLINKLKLSDPGADAKVDAKNAEVLKIIKHIRESYIAINESITDELKHLFMFSGKIKIKDNDIEKRVDHQLERRLTERTDAEGNDNPLLEVSEEMRQEAGLV